MRRSPRRAARSCRRSQSAFQRNVQQQPPTNLFAGDRDPTELWSERRPRSAAAVGRGTYSAGWIAARTRPTACSPASIPSSAPACCSASRSRCCVTSRSTPRAQLDDQPSATARSPASAAREHGQHRRRRRAGYWLLVAALALVDVQQRSLELALELERNNRARVDVGQSPPLDLVSARAEVAQRQENLIIARRRGAADRGHPAHAHHRSERPTTGTFGSSRRIASPSSARAGRRRRGAPRLGERTDLSGARNEIQNTETTSRCRRARRCPTCACRPTISTTAPAARA